MKKEEIIEILKADHQGLAKVLDLLSSQQLEEVKILGDWNVKDVLAHLVEWNCECLAEIDRVLGDKATWQKFYESEEGEDEFNRKAIEKWKGKSLKEVLEEWEKSFQAWIKRIEELNEKEWKYQSKGDVWSNGEPVTVQSLFDYEYEGASHESGHAKQIKDFFKI